MKESKKTIEGRREITKRHTDEILEHILRVYKVLRKWQKECKHSKPTNNGRCKYCSKRLKPKRRTK